MIIQGFHFGLCGDIQKNQQGINSRDSNRCLYTMFIAALFTMAKKIGKNNIHMDERINKMCSIHTMEYYSAMRVDILKHATTGINLEDILLSELKQYKGTNRVPLIWDTQSNHSLPGDSIVYNLPAMQQMWVPPLGQEDPQRRKCQPAPVFLPGRSHEQRSLVGCSPWVPKRVGHDLAIKDNKGSSNS